MAWTMLILAGVFEMLAVVMMNQWHNVKTKLNFILMILAFVISFICLAYALSYISMSVGYAIWTGIGAAGGALIGIVLYKESANWKRIFFLLLIIGAVIGLKLVG